MRTDALHLNARRSREGETLKTTAGLLVASVAILTNLATSALGYEFTTLNHPLAVNGTFPLAVDGSTIVGFYRDSNLHEHGFSFDGSTYTTLDHPSAGGTTAFRGTIAYDVWGTTVVGAYSTSDATVTKGFVHDGSTWTTVDAGPGATIARGIYGNNVVGFYSPPASSVFHGFLYDGASYVTLDHPLAIGQTYPRDIWENTIVGYYVGEGDAHGFTWDGTTYTTLDHPLSNAGARNGTYAVGLSGSTVAGWYYHDSVSHGFIHDGATWRTVDHPLGAGGTSVWGVSSSTIVGFYTDSSNQLHGFMATVPEPGLMAITIPGLCWCAVRRRNARQ